MCYILQLIDKSKDETIANNETEERIRTKKMCAVADRTATSNQIGGHWKILNLHNHAVTRKEISNKEWRAHRPKDVEATLIVDMLEFVI